MFIQPDPIVCSFSPDAGLSLIASGARLIRDTGGKWHLVRPDDIECVTRMPEAGIRVYLSGAPRPIEVSRDAAKTIASMLANQDAANAVQRI